MILRGPRNVPDTFVDECHDGVGRIRVRQLLGYGPLLPVGATIGAHPHSGNEELYFVIDGLGR